MNNLSSLTAEDKENLENMLEVRAQARLKLVDLDSTNNQKATIENNQEIRTQLLADKAAAGINTESELEELKKLEGGTINPNEKNPEASSASSENKTPPDLTKALELLQEFKILEDRETAIYASFPNLAGYATSMTAENFTRAITSLEWEMRFSGRDLNNIPEYQMLQGSLLAARAQLTQQIKALQNNPRYKELSTKKETDLTPAEEKELAKLQGEINELQFKLAEVKHNLDEFGKIVNALQKSIGGSKSAAEAAHANSLGQSAGGIYSRISVLANNMETTAELLRLNRRDMDQLEQKINEMHTNEAVTPQNVRSLFKEQLNILLDPRSRTEHTAMMLIENSWNTLENAVNSGETNDIKNAITALRSTLQAAGILNGDNNIGTFNNIFGLTDPPADGSFLKSFGELTTTGQTICDSSDPKLDSGVELAQSKENLLSVFLLKTMKLLDKPRQLTFYHESNMSANVSRIGAAALSIGAQKNMFANAWLSQHFRRASDPVDENNKDKPELNDSQWSALANSFVGIMDNPLLSLDEKQEKLENSLTSTITQSLATDDSELAFIIAASKAKPIVDAIMANEDSAEKLIDYNDQLSATTGSSGKDSAAFSDFLRDQFPGIDQKIQGWWSITNNARQEEFSRLFGTNNTLGSSLEQLENIAINNYHQGNLSLITRQDTGYSENNPGYGAQYTSDVLTAEKMQCAAIDGIGDGPGVEDGVNIQSLEDDVKNMLANLDTYAPPSQEGASSDRDALRYRAGVILNIKEVIVDNGLGQDFVDRVESELAQTLIDIENTFTRDGSVGELVSDPQGFQDYIVQELICEKNPAVKVNASDNESADSTDRGQQLSTVLNGASNLQAVSGSQFVAAGAPPLNPTPNGLLTNANILQQVLGEINPALTAALTNTQEPGVEISGAIRYVPNKSDEINYEASRLAILALGEQALAKLGLAAEEIEFLRNPQGDQAKLQDLVDKLAGKLKDDVRALVGADQAQIYATANQEQGGKSILGSYGNNGNPLPASGNLQNISAAQKGIYQGIIEQEINLALNRAENTTGQRPSIATFTVSTDAVKTEVSAQLDAIYGSREAWDKIIQVMSNTDLEEVGVSTPTGSVESGEGLKGTYVTLKTGSGQVTYMSEHNKLEYIARGVPQEEDQQADVKLAEATPLKASA
jgi:hypothetical protein